MRRALSTVQPSLLDFSNFAGGLNLRLPPEQLSENELAECVNMTYSSAPGKLRTRAGIGEPLAEFGNRVNGLYWFAGKLLAAVADGKLYDVATAEGETTSEIGALSGSWRPVWCEYGGKLYIASHGKLQEYNGTTLTTIVDSPNADFVYARAGRLFCSYDQNDTIRGSAVGDPSTWTIPVSPSDSDPVEIQIGYKVAGNILMIVPAINDVIVFKTHGIFRLIGEYPDWSIKEITRDEMVTTNHSAVSVAGFVYYLDLFKGVRLLQGTQGYDEITPSEALPNVNPWLRGKLHKNFSGIWHLPARNMLIVNPDDSSANEVMPAYYEFGFNAMPALLWQFHGPVQAIVEPDRDHLYIAVSNGVYDFSGVSAYDPTGENCSLELVKSRFSTKLYRGFSQYVIKRVSIRAESPIKQVLTTVPCHVNVNDVTYLDLLFNHDESPIVYGNNAAVYQNQGELVAEFFDVLDFAKHNLCRQDTVQFHFDNEGAPFELTRFAVEMVPVGVTA